MCASCSSNWPSLASAMTILEFLSVTNVLIFFNVTPSGNIESKSSEFKTFWNGLLLTTAFTSSADKLEGSLTSDFIISKFSDVPNCFRSAKVKPAGNMEFIWSELKNICIGLEFSNIFASSLSNDFGSLSNGIITFATSEFINFATVLRSTFFGKWSATMLDFNSI